MKRLGEIGLNALTVCVGISSLLMGGAVVRREWFTEQPVALGAPAPPRLVDDWETIASGGRRMGAPNAAVTIVTYNDFQCPFCRRLALGQLKSLRAEFPNELAVVHKDWPLPGHKFAYPAARGGACADAQGRFEQYHDLVYTQQDKLASKAISRFGAESGVADMKAFNRCISETAPRKDITSSIAEVTRLGGTGTPTILVNGYLLSRGADSVVVDSLVRAAIRQRLRS